MSDALYLHPHQIQVGDLVVGFVDHGPVTEVRYRGEYPHVGMQAELGSKFSIHFRDGFELAATGKGTKPVVRPTTEETSPS